MNTRITDIVVAGGTTGMGKGIAMHYLSLGCNVTVIGSTSARGMELRKEAEKLGAANRLRFIQADLMSVSENYRVVKEIKATHKRLDALILTAMKPFPMRVETEDGFEGTLSLYYVSRFILSYGLTELLEKGEDPIIVSLGGTGVIKGKMHWEDMTLIKKYSLLTAMKQANCANDLQGVGYAENHKGGKIKFVLNHPGYTNSGLGHMKQPIRSIMKVLATLFAQSVEKSIKPIIELIDTPPNQPLIAWNRSKLVELTDEIFDVNNAKRLYELTKYLVADYSGINIGNNQ